MVITKEIVKDIVKDVERNEGDKGEVLGVYFGINEKKLCYFLDLQGQRLLGFLYNSKVKYRYFKRFELFIDSTTTKDKTEYLYNTLKSEF